MDLSDLIKCSITKSFHKKKCIWSFLTCSADQRTLRVRTGCSGRRNRWRAPSTTATTRPPRRRWRRRRRHTLLANDTVASGISGRHPGDGTPDVRESVHPSPTVQFLSATSGRSVHYCYLLGSRDRGWRTRVAHDFRTVCKRCGL